MLCSCSRDRECESLISVNEHLLTKLLSFISSTVWLNLICIHLITFTEFGMAMESLLLLYQHQSH